MIPVGAILSGGKEGKGIIEKAMPMPLTRLTNWRKDDRE
jgi:hypothetical protein